MICVETGCAQTAVGRALFFVYAAQFLRPAAEVIWPAITPQIERNIF